MVAFPETLRPSFPYAWEDAFENSVIGPYKDGNIYTKDDRDVPIRMCELSWQGTEYDQVKELYQFFHDMKGRHGIFSFFDFFGMDLTPIGVEWPVAFVGVRDGATTLFDSPFKNTSSPVLQSNGVTLTNTSPSAPSTATEYRINVGAGIDGTDQIQLGAAGTAGHQLWEKARGRRRTRASFWGSDKIRLTTNTALATTIASVQIIERRA